MLYSFVSMLEYNVDLCLCQLVYNLTPCLCQLVYNLTPPPNFPYICLISCFFAMVTICMIRSALNSIKKSHWTNASLGAFMQSRTNITFSLSAHAFCLQTEVSGWTGKDNGRIVKRDGQKRPYI